ncbi:MULTISPECIES: acyltransferase [unclassified Enterococcus]|uniref:acyltransferase n=1 Tax=unclassified Enterococcus TaxID=2608891 RepID=UPI003D2B9280
MKFIENFLFKRKKRKIKFIGENVRISSDALLENPESIRFESDTYLGPDAKILGKGSLSIGSGTVIGHAFTCYTTRYNYESNLLPYDFNERYETITIGKNVWIGGNVTIVKGVTIGEGAVIGAGSVITKDIPECAVAVGNPAQIIKYRNQQNYCRNRDSGNVYLKIKSIK